MRRHRPMKRSGFVGPRAEIKRSPIKQRGKRAARKASATRRLRNLCRERWPQCVAAQEAAGTTESGCQVYVAHWGEGIGSWILHHVCSDRLETAHILGKAAHPAIEFDPDNVVTLCHEAHSWFTCHPAAWRDFIEALLPGRWDDLLRRERGEAA